LVLQAGSAGGGDAEADRDADLRGARGDGHGVDHRREGDRDSAHLGGHSESEGEEGGGKQQFHSCRLPMAKASLSDRWGLGILYFQRHEISIEIRKPLLRGSPEVPVDRNAPIWYSSSGHARRTEPPPPRRRRPAPPLVAP